MAVEVETLLWQLEANQKKLERNLKAANQNVNKRSRNIEKRFDRMNKRISRSMTQAGRAVRGALAPLGVGGVLSAGGLVLVTKLAIDAADAIGKTAAAVGLSTDALQEYQLAADLAGVGQEQFNKGLLAFNKTLGELRQGRGTLVEFLKDYDAGMIDALAATEDTEEALDIFLRGLDAAEDGFTKVALGAAAFERSGKKMVLLLRNDGVEGLNAMRQAAQDLGLVLEKDLIDRGEQAADSLTIIQRVFSVNFQRALLGLTPLIIDLGAALGDAAPAIADFTRSIAEFFGVGDRFAGLEELNADLAETEKRILTIVKLFRDAQSATGAAGRLTGETADRLREEHAELKKTRDELLKSIVARKANDAVIEQARARLKKLNEEEEEAGASRDEREAVLHEKQLARMKAFIQAAHERQNEVTAAADAEHAARMQQLEEEAEARREVIKTHTELIKAAMASKSEAEKAAEEMKQATGAAVKGFVSDLRNGVSATEALSNALSRLADKLIDLALNLILFGSTGTGGTGGILGAIFGAKDGGQASKAAGRVVRRARGGQVRGPGGPRGDRIPALLSDEEFVINARSARGNEAFLEAFNKRGAVALAAGGPVPGSLASRPVPAMQAAASASGAAPVIMPAPSPDLTVINTFNPEDALARALETRRGEEIFLNFVSDNAATIAATLPAREG